MGSIESEGKQHTVMKISQRHICHQVEKFLFLNLSPDCVAGLGTLGCICPLLPGTIPCEAMPGPEGTIEGLFIRIPAKNCL